MQMSEEFSVDIAPDSLDAQIVTDLKFHGRMNAGGYYAEFASKSSKYQNRRHAVNNAFSRLVSYGFLRRVNRVGGKVFYELTQEGRQQADILLEYQRRSFGRAQDDLVAMLDDPQLRAELSKPLMEIVEVYHRKYRDVPHDATAKIVFGTFRETQPTIKTRLEKGSRFYKELFREVARNP